MTTPRPSPLDSLLPKRTGAGPRVAVIGVGLSGVVAARALSAAGYSVQVFEKSRGPGGRMATRRTDAGDTFDHGAQYFTARDALFQEQVRSWVEAGVTAEWHGDIATLEQGQVTRSEREQVRYVGVPGMGSGVKRLAEGLDVRSGVRVERVVREVSAMGSGVKEPTEGLDSRSGLDVERVERAGGAWTLTTDSGEWLGVFDVVVVAVPAPQAVPLLAGAPALAARAATVRMEPCQAVMVRFAERVPLEVDAACVHDSPLSWIARDASKPGRAAGERWVLHGSPEASRESLESPPDMVAARWVEAFAQASGLVVRPLEAVAHRWRYALPSPALEESALFDAALGIGACGDWCGGPRVEGAFLSGVALARKIGSI